MRLATTLKWLIPGAALLGAAAVVFACYSQDRFVGHPAAGPPIALLGARIYDPAGDSLIESATVIIEAGEITEVDADAVIPDSALVLSLHGLTLLPGFIDSHVHLSGASAYSFAGVRDLGWIPYFWRFVHSFPGRRRALIEAGVTSVVSLGDPHPWIVQLARRIERHELAGPRIFAAGPMFTAPGGHPVAELRAAGRGDTSFIAQLTRQVVGPREAALALSELVGSVDLITAVLESRGAARLPTLTRPTLGRLTAAAHARGLQVVAHVGTLSSVYDALAAGVDGIEHVPTDRDLNEILLAEMRERRVHVDPTLAALTERLAVDGASGLAQVQTARRNVLALFAAGIPLLVGSDAPNPGTYFGQTYHDELRGLVKLGLTPRQVIAAATSVPAERLGLSDRLGSPVPGRWADLIAVGGDPLLDIRAAGDIYLVIADGQILVNRLGVVRRPGAVIARATEPVAAGHPSTASARVPRDRPW